MAERRDSSRTGKWIVILVVTVGIAAFFYLDIDRYLSLESLKANRDALLAYTQQHYEMAALTFIGIYIVQTALSLPGGAILTLAGGFLFGTVMGTILVNIGATIGATLAFLAARYVLRDWVERTFGDRLAPIQAGFAQHAFHYLLTLRLIPIFPFFLVNLVSGLTRISLATYVSATAIGIIPGSFVYAYAGRQLGTINSLSEIASPQVLLAFTLLGVFALLPVLYRTFTAPRGKRP
ncbi:MAG: TVP38/TMEM64 family protein [Nitrospirae bacterium]|nr:MAG: TVP38/TMEM64 family protein [Nitrospirota bacterium]